METETTILYKWQPVMLVTDHRIDCQDCGALAVFVVVEGYTDSNATAETGTYCQPCFQRHQEE